MCAHVGMILCAMLDACILRHAFVWHSFCTYRHVIVWHSRCVCTGMVLCGAPWKSAGARLIPGLGCLPVKHAHAECGLAFSALIPQLAANSLEHMLCSCVPSA